MYKGIAVLAPFIKEKIDDWLGNMLNNFIGSCHNQAAGIYNQIL